MKLSRARIEELQKKVQDKEIRLDQMVDIINEEFLMEEEPISYVNGGITEDLLLSIGWTRDGEIWQITGSRHQAKLTQRGFLHIGDYHPHYGFEEKMSVLSVNQLLSSFSKIYGKRHILGLIKF